MDNQQTSETEATLPADANESPQNSPCVLLVEDDRSLRRFLEVTLQRAGYRVIGVGDGLEAMKVAFSDSIDVIVTDAIMPHLSGQQLAAFIRNDPKVSKIPIILLTGQENKAAAMTTEVSIDAFLYKPVKADELKNCIEDCLSKQ
jgi:DNA-binding response OmpR family regulator